MRTQRRWLVGLLVAALAAATCTLVLARPPAANAVQVLCGGDATVFAVRPNGDLFDYEHAASATGQFAWSYAAQVGGGWTGRTLAGGPSGVVYLITASGDLREYGYGDHGRWNFGGGVTIGNGFQRYVTNPNLITASGSAIYAVNAAGELRRYRWNQTGAFGTGFWSNGAGDVLGTGWNKYRMIAETGDALYAIDQQGNVFRYSTSDESANWAGQQVASGWNYTSLTSPGGDVLYAVDGNSGNLYWYHYNVDNGTFDNYGQPKLIGQGWYTSTFAQVTAMPGVCNRGDATGNGAVNCVTNAMVLDARPNGDLWDYEQTNPNSRGFTWTNTRPIGGGFGPRVLGGPNGTIFLVTAAGALRVYSYDDARGWTNAGGRVIDTGFQRYATNPNLITSDGFGHIFAVDATGELRSYLYNQVTGTLADGAGTPLDSGWNRYRLIVASDDNQIFAIDNQDNLFWYSYDSTAQRWTQYAKPIATGWHYSTVFSAGGDLLYAIDGGAGAMYSYQFNELTGVWSTPTNRLVGVGWYTSLHPNVTAVTNACAAPFAVPTTTAAQCATNLPVFDTRTNGDLWLYHGTTPKQLGTGFIGHTLGGAHGDIFNITPDGDLRLYHFDGTQLTNNGAFQTIAQGWGAYVSGPGRSLVTVDSANDIYTVDANGVLRMYHYDETSGTWDVNGLVVQDNWAHFQSITAAGYGVLYGYDPVRGVYRFQYDPASRRWLYFDVFAMNSFNNPFAGATQVFSPGGDMVYRVATDGTMSWTTTSATFRDWGLPNQIDVGWVNGLHQDITTSTDACGAPPPAVAPVTPLAAKASAPIALAGDRRSPTVPAMTLHYFYRDDTGHVIAATDSGASGLATQQIGTRTFTSDVAAVTTHDMAVAAIDSTGEVWLSRSTTDPFPDFQPLGGSMRSVALFAFDDQLQIYGVDGDGNLWMSVEAAPPNEFGTVLSGADAGMTAWQRILSGGHLAGPITVAAGGGGQVYVTDGSGNVLLVQPDGGSPTDTFGWGQQVCVAVGADFEFVGASGLSVVARSRASGQLSVSAGGCSTPSALSNPVAAVDQPVAFSPLGGGYGSGVAVAGTDGVVYLTYGQVGSAWLTFGAEAAATSPSLAADVSGGAGVPVVVDLVYRGGDGKIYHYQAEGSSVSHPPLVFGGGPHS